MRVADLTTRYAVVIAAVTLIITSLTACGSGSTGSPVLAPDQSALDTGRTGFSLADPGAEQTPGLGIHVTERGKEALVSVVAERGLTLDAVFFELSYDTGSYTPQVVQATDAFSPPADSLIIEMLEAPGLVSFGQVPLGGPGNNVAPGTVLAQVLFSTEPLPADRLAAAVPVQRGALCPLTYNDRSGVMILHYVNPGDYDQNGTVSASDLVPLGRHFNETGPFDFKTAQAVIDGNHNGLIEIADLSVIGQNWGNEVDRFHLYGSDDIGDMPAGNAAPSTLTRLDRRDFQQGMGDPASVRLQFRFDVDPAAALAYYWARPAAVTDSVLSEGIPSNPAGPGILSQPDDPVNQKPVAQLTMTHEEPEVPFTVIFDARESYDSDGVITHYAWDFEGDDLYDAIGTDRMAIYTYKQAGVFSPQVRVFDNLGAWDVFQSPFLVVTNNLPNTLPVADIFPTTQSGQVPLVVGFSAAESTDADGSITKYQWDFDGDGEIELNSGADPTVLHTYETPGTFLATVIVTDDREGTGSAQVEISVSALPDPNIEPVADLVPNPAYGEVPVTVTLDAGASVDSDGTIVNYEWDIDGDGQYEEYGPGDTCQATYTEYGIAEVAVRVTDDRGATASATAQIRVNQAIAEYDIWSMSGHDPRHTHRSSAIGPQTSNIKWSFITGSHINSSPAIGADGTIYFGSNDSRFYALNPDSSLKWSYLTEGAIRSSPAIGSDGTIYFGSADNHLYALNPDGSLKWRFHGFAEVSSPVIAPDGTIYFGVYASRFYALNPNGTLKWGFYNGGTRFTSAPAIGIDGTIYAGCWDEVLMAFNPDGTVQWSFATQGRIEASPAIGMDGTIYVASYDNKFYALRPDGSLKWVHDTPSRITSGPSIDADGNIYLGNWQNFQAYNPQGLLSWTSFMAPTSSCTAAIDAEGKLYVGASGSSFLAFDNDGDILWTALTLSGFSSSPAIGANGIVYVGCDDGRLYAFGDNTAPLAYLNSDVGYGDPGLTVTFDTSASTDNDGLILTYDWDFDGDGTWDTMTTEPGSSHTYLASGVFNVTVQVTDNHGATDTASIPIRVNEVFDPAELWSVYGHDRRNTRQSQFTGPQTANLQWTHRTGIAADESPVIGPDGTLYVVNQLTGMDAPYLLEAINPDGSSRWTFETGGRINSDPVIGPDGTIYINTSSGWLYAINPDGSQKWQHLTGNFYSSNAAATAGGTVYIGSGDFSIHAVNPDGTSQWQYPTGGIVTATPAVGMDGTIYCGCLDSTLYALNPDGSPQWTFSAGDAISSSPALGTDGTVYFGCRDGLVYAINPDGSLLWTYPTGDQITSSPVVAADGTIYFGSYDHRLYAINPDGSLRWSYETGWSIYADPMIGPDGAIYIGSFDNHMYAINPDGSLRWSYDTGSSISATAAIDADGNIHLVTNNYYLVTLYPDGTLKQLHDTWTTLYNTLTGPDGTVYASGSDTVYAINPDGSDKWMYYLDEINPRTLAVGPDGAVYAGDGSGDNVYAINADGSLRWMTPVTDSIYAPPAISKTGTVYFGSTNGRLFAVHPTGVLQWTANLGASIAHAPAIGPDGTIYVSCHNDNEFYACSPDGVIEWTCVLDGLATTGPAIAEDGTLYVGCNNNRLHTVNPDGTTGWSYSMGATIYDGVAIGSDGAIHFGCSNRNLYALNPDGSLRWSYEALNMISKAPVVDADGSVYFTDTYEVVYALDSAGSLLWNHSMDDRSASAPMIGAGGVFYVASELSLYAFGP